jgi:hypothetical protein
MKLSFLLMLLLPGTSLFAQVQGKLKDTDNRPIAAATLVMYKANDSGLIKTAVSNNDGLYAFEVAPGNYYIKASSLGYKEIKTSPFRYNGAAIELPTLLLERKDNSLSNIVVKTTRPVIEVKADKMIYNIESNPAATGLDGMELLRQSPGVLVDYDDNVSIAGKSGVQIFIDGKPSPLSGKDLANYLRTLRSTAIEAIEVINNPSAKYDAAGTGGIINIRLKKNTSYGTNGSVNAEVQKGKWEAYNTGFSLNNRNQLFNLFGNYNYSKPIREFDLDVYRHVLDSIFDSYSATVTRNTSHNYKGGIDRFINKFSTIGVLVSGTVADDRTTSDNVTYIRGDHTSSIDRVLISDNRASANKQTLNANINYAYNNKGRSLNIDGDYGSFKLRSDQYQPNVFYDPSMTIKYSERNYSMVTPSDITIWSFKADYEQDLWKGRLAAGTKLAYINSDNVFNSFNEINSKPVYDSVLSNQFLYKENINAVYASYNRSLKTIQFMIGLRAEQTLTTGTSTGFKKNSSGFDDYKEKFTRDMIDLFPSGNITFTKNPKSIWTISYSGRINRPSYQNLNPFEMRGSEYGGFKGNPNLRPEFANTFSLINVFKTRLVTNLSYTEVKDVIVNISDTLNGTKSFYFPKNLAKQKNASLNINYSFNKKWFSFNGGLTGFYTHNMADFGPGRQVDLKVGAVTSYIQPNAKLGKGWSVNMRVMYESPKLFRGTMKQDAFYGVNLGIQKMMLDDKLTIRGNWNDVFNSIEFFGTSDFAGQYLTARAWWDPRRVIVAMSYRFGSNKIKSTRQRKTGIDDESKRATDSGQ